MRTIKQNVTVLTRLFILLHKSTIVKMKQNYQMNPNIPMQNDNKIDIDPVKKFSKKKQRI